MQELVIEAGRTERHYWRDLWRYRELFYFLAWRDILVRYKQTAIGVAWAVVRPLLTTVVFTLLFSRISKLPAPGPVPYSLLVMAGMLAWQFFSTSLSEASLSLINNTNLVSKVYFPRVIVPASAVITNLVDFVITLGLMTLMMIWFRFLPDWRIVAFPLFLLLAFGVSIGAGLWLCALSVKYRDFRYVIPFVVQIGAFIAPVGYSSAVAAQRFLPASWQWLYSLNPLVGVIEGFRWCLLRGEGTDVWISTLLSFIVVIALLASGVWYFRRMERTFADII